MTRLSLCPGLSVTLGWSPTSDLPTGTVAGILGWEVGSATCVAAPCTWASFQADTTVSGSGISFTVPADVGSGGSGWIGTAAVPGELDGSAAGCTAESCTYALILDAAYPADVATTCGP